MSCWWMVTKIFKYLLKASDIQFGIINKQQDMEARQCFLVQYKPPFVSEKYSILIRKWYNLYFEGSIINKGE
jgi:hypothetical protein